MKHDWGIHDLLNPTKCRTCLTLDAPIHHEFFSSDATRKAEAVVSSARLAGRGISGKPANGWYVPDFNPLAWFLYSIKHTCHGPWPTELTYLNYLHLISHEGILSPEHLCKSLQSVHEVVSAGQEQGGPTKLGLHEGELLPRQGRGHRGEGCYAEHDCQGES